MKIKKIWFLLIFFNPVEFKPNNNTNKVEEADFDFGSNPFGQDDFGQQHHHQQQQKTTTTTTTNNNIQPIYPQNTQPIITNPIYPSVNTQQPKQQIIINTTSKPNTNTNSPVSTKTPQPQKSNLNDDPFSFLTDITKKDTEVVKQEIIESQKPQEKPKQTNPFDMNPFEAQDPFNVNTKKKQQILLMIF